MVRFSCALSVIKKANPVRTFAAFPNELEDLDAFDKMMELAIGQSSINTVLRSHGTMHRYSISVQESVKIGDTDPTCLVCGQDVSAIRPT
jgi:hypothetical protein